MSVVVATPPTLLVTPTEAKRAAPVLRGDDDFRVEVLLTVAQAALEPPSWVGSSLAKQTLKARFGCWPDPSFRLPFGPVIRIVEVGYLDEHGARQTLDADVYDLQGAGERDARIVLRDGQGWPSAGSAWNAVEVTFEAGHDADDPRLRLARHAVILSAVQLRSLSTEDLALRTVDVPGVESRTYTVSDAAEKLTRSAVESLMSSFRVYSV